MAVWYVRLTHPNDPDLFREGWIEVPDDAEDPRNVAIMLARRQNERITADLRSRQPPVDVPLYELDEDSVHEVDAAPEVELDEPRPRRRWGR